MRLKFLSTLIKSVILIAMCTQLLSCNEKKPEAIKQKQSKPDSLLLSIEMASKGYYNFHFVGELYFDEGYYFENDTIATNTYSKKFSLKYKHQIISSTYMQMKPSKYIKHYFLIDDKAKKLDFTFKDGVLTWPESNDALVLDDIYESYLPIRIQLNFASYSSKENLIDQIDSIYKSNQINHANKPLIQEVNHLHYIDKLQKIDPYNLKVTRFIENMKEDPIASFVTARIFINYIKFHIDKINYEELNTDRYSSVFVKLFTKAMYHYLRDSENRGDSQNVKGINWYKQTAYYKEHKELFEPEITPLDNEEFKRRISKLTLLDENQNILSFESIVKKNPSDFYLIDFWATWCGPCKDGMKRIKNMTLPEKVKVINLSLDNIKNLKKWKKYVNKTDQKLSFLINKKDMENKAFVKFIRIKSIPRYLIIDKDMNLIDEEFYRPHEPKFIKDLNGL